MPAVTPHGIKGTIYDIFGNALAGATVTVTHSSITPVLPETTDSEGHYLINLGGLDSQWTVGQSITINATKEAEGRISLTTAITSGANQTHDLTLTETSDFDFETQPDLSDRYPFSMVMPVHYDGAKVTRSRPFPVRISDINLIDNPAYSWTITNQDGQPDSETVTLANGEQYKRTFTYTTIGGGRTLTSRSKWVKQ
ncbi:hypothetical protein LCGC14_1657580 [marine sediment metagenome]|uniref:Carboxypeptidase regulatory-like domain-containing protein n=1 Tax=marine sediment metagenome TaxID=412755 RepID=A0A0F9IHF1_9ZZZZ